MPPLSRQVRQSADLDLTLTEFPDPTGEATYFLSPAKEIAVEDELIEAGVNIVIYANHLLRSAYPSMVKTAETILQHQRALEAEEYCMPIKKILTLIPGSK